MRLFYAIDFYDTKVYKFDGWFWFFFETSSRPEFFKKKTDFLCDSVSSVGWRLNSPPAPSTTTTTTAAVFDLCLGFSTKPDFSGTSLQLHCDCSSPEVPRSSLLFDKAASTSSLAQRQWI
jgi:hypothetical protein